MKKTLKSILFDPQVADTGTAKREQLLVMAMMLVLGVMALAFL